MIWIKRVAFISCVAVLAAGAVFALSRQAGLFNVRSIPIEISQHVDAAQAPFRADAATISDLQARLEKKIKIWEQKKIWEIDIDRISALIRADDWVRHVRISRAFPNRLEVAVSPRAPVFLLATSRNKLVPIAADGSVVTMVNESLLPDVPVLRGDRFLNDESLRRRAIEFARQLPEEGPLSLNEIAEVRFSAEDGFVILLLPSQTEIKFGEELITLKVARVEQIIDYLNAHQLKGRVIDASFSKKVLVRLRKGP